MMNRLSTVRRAAIALAVCMAGVSGAAEAGETRFGLGVTGGYSAIKVESTTTEVAGVATSTPASFTPSGANFGLTARLTHELDGGVFFGAQGNAVLERGDDERGDETGIAPISTRVEVERSFDLMGRLGKRFGAVSPYVTGGVSWLQTKSTVSEPPADTASTKDTHRGWKLGLGADYDVTDRVTLFVELAHARYGKENYTFSDGGSDVLKANAKIHTNEFKLGVLYNF